MNHEHGNKHYRHLIIMAALSFIAMYILMHAMVDRFENVYPNYNQFYMASLMVAPMVVIELLVMRGMYKDKKLNMLILALSVALGVLFCAGVRQQTMISDEQFLKSVIPHHAGPILMCKSAPAQDGKIKNLCTNIISSQQSEIDQMKALLAKLKN